MTAEPEQTAWRLGRPYLIRHVLLPGLAGALAGLVCVGVLLALDMGGLRTLMAASGVIFTDPSPDMLGASRKAMQADVASLATAAKLSPEVVRLAEESVNGTA